MVGGIIKGLNRFTLHPTQDRRVVSFELDVRSHHCKWDYIGVYYIMHKDWGAVAFFLRLKSPLVAPQSDKVRSMNSG